MRNYINKPGSTKKPNGWWKVKEHCIEEARKYKTPTEWQNSSRGSFYASYKYNWMRECTSHVDKKRNKIPRVVSPPSIKERISAENKIMKFLGYENKKS